jgi:multiple sugar transport system permease protein
MATTTPIHIRSNGSGAKVEKPIRIHWAQLISLTLLIFGAVIMLLPLLWMFSTSLRATAESYNLPPAFLPTSWHWENYATVFKGSVPMVRLAGNSLFVTLSVTLGQLVTCSMAGYAFGRLRFPGQNALFFVLLAALMVPAQITIIPVFIIMRNLGLIDNLFALILPALINPFGVFLMRQHFLTVPQELIDAAKIDGASYWKTFMQVALPLAGPVLSALAILTFNNTWNAYFQPLIFINTWEKMTLPLGIAALRSYMGAGNPSVILAAVSLAILPVLAIFLAAQRWIIEGITRTGIKG